MLFIIPVFILQRLTTQHEHDEQAYLLQERSSEQTTFWQYTLEAPTKWPP